MKRHTLGIINGIMASVSYGTNPLFALPLYMQGLGTNSILFYRYMFATIIYGLWITLKKQVSLKITLKEFFSLLFLSLLFSLSSLTLYESFKLIEAGIACTILFVYPIIVVVIMAIFFEEKITLKIVTSIILTFGGISLLYTGKAGIPLNIQGVIMVLLSALSYALYIVGVKKLKSIKHLKPDKLNFYVMLFGLFVYIYNLKFCTQLEIPENHVSWIFVLGLAIFPTILSIETITIAIKLVGSTTTAILGALEPLTAIFFGIIFFNEHLTIKIMIGVALILTGVLLIVTGANNGKSNFQQQKS